MTIDALWVAVAQRSKLPREGVLAVYPKGIAVLLLHKDGEVYAVANRCAHMACPLEGGLREGFIITCPCHDWSFDLRSGEMLEAPEVKLPVFPVRVEGEDVLVRLPEAGI